jgi:hypothetical protein
VSVVAAAVVGSLVVATLALIAHRGGVVGA